MELDDHGTNHGGMTRYNPVTVIPFPGLFWHHHVIRDGSKDTGRGHERSNSQIVSTAFSRVNGSELEAQTSA